MATTHFSGPLVIGPNQQAATVTGNGLEIASGNLQLDSGSIVVSGQSNYVIESAKGGIVAHSGGGIGSATPLTATYNLVATVAANNDSVQLPVSVAGMQITVINNGADTLAVFPQAADTINGGSAGASVTQATPPQVTIYTCVAAGAWFTK